MICPVDPDNSDRAVILVAIVRRHSHLQVPVEVGIQYTTITTEGTRIRNAYLNHFGSSS